MSRKTQAEKLASKRAEWTRRTAAVFGVSEEEAVALLATSRRQSLRLNALKAPPEKALENLRRAGWQGERFSWCNEGYSIDVPFEIVRDSDPVMQGEVFIQNAASWLPVLALDPKPDEVILDVCAAPGGKTSHIAAITSNRAQIWANDSSKPRLAKLRANLERLGARIENFTLFDAQRLSHKLEGKQFDKILIDAPCSGEGLRNIANDKDVLGWSVAHIKRLQKEQKNIIRQAWQLLKPGGVLVYSTCTMAPEENEAVVDFLLRTCSDAFIEEFGPDLPNRAQPVLEWNSKQFSAEIAKCLRLKPSEQIEAFFVCKLRKGLN